MRDARRRNRNIGTAKAGHGKNNRHVVPERWHDLVPFWQKLSSYVVLKKQLGDVDLTFVLERPLAGSWHHCTVEDVCAVLGLFPRMDTAGIKLVVFRQPTRRQQILAPVWGRLGYWSEIGATCGVGLYLEAQPLEKVQTWPISLAPSEQRELARLRRDGHVVTRGKREYRIESTSENIRATQLFRTIPHEIGHFVDYTLFTRKTRYPPTTEEFWELFRRSRPEATREAFAHQYADEFYDRMRLSGHIPFPRLLDPVCWQTEGLDPSWFMGS